MITFITTDYLRNQTAISNNLDVELIAPFIYQAELFHIIPILNETFTDSLKSILTNETASGYTEVLLDKVMQCTAWFTYYEALPFLVYRTHQLGIVKNFSDNSQAISEKDYDILKSEIYEKANSYKKLMIDYLDENKTQFPLYVSNCQVNRVSNDSGIFLG